VTLNNKVSTDDKNKGCPDVPGSPYSFLAGSFCAGKKTYRAGFQIYRAGFQNPAQPGFGFAIQYPLVSTLVVSKAVRGRHAAQGKSGDFP
jgi:hypothetical protein